MVPIILQGKGGIESVAEFPEWTQLAGITAQSQPRQAAFRAHATLLPNT